MEAFLNNTHMMAVVLDERFNFIWVNPSYARTCGYDVSYFPGKNHFALYPHQENEAIFQRVVETGEPFFVVAKPFDFPDQPERGTTFWDWSLIPIKDDNGKVNSLVFTLAEVTDRIIGEKALKEANKKLSLLSSITRHDIRNQLSIINGYLGILEEKANDHSFDAEFKSIINASSKIESLIQFMKTYEEIGVKAPMWQNVWSLVNEVKSRFHDSGLEVENSIPHGLEIYADPLIINVFSNIVDNAIRHGQKASKICFSIEKAEDKIMIICEDDGEGISENARKDLFTQRKGLDHGFGLFLSKEILSITGIGIREAGQFGKGAKFVLEPQRGWVRVLDHDH